ncbi:MAG TPA: hypothetical protein VJX92_03660 [Methylomirabilota bacterium]|nr:hypothetical protein [Methylomirabilota bacterium]
MKLNVVRFVVIGIRNVSREMIAQIREINRRYATPHITTTRMVRVCLLVLRGYLILLVGILIYKFISILR